MKKFIYLVLAIVIIMFVFEDKVRPYTDPVVEKAKFIWVTYLATPFEYSKDFYKYAKDFIEKRIFDKQIKESNDNDKEKESNRERESEK